MSDRKFEPDKYYKSTNGSLIHTLDYLDTTVWGRALVAEQSRSVLGYLLIVVGADEVHSIQNYMEITKEEWLANYKNPEKDFCLFLFNGETRIIRAFGIKEAVRESGLARSEIDFWRCYDARKDFVYNSGTKSWSVVIR